MDKLPTGYLSINLDLSCKLYKIILSQPYEFPTPKAITLQINDTIISVNSILQIITLTLISLPILGLLIIDDCRFIQCLYFRCLSFHKATLKLLILL